jgi:Arc/MetJ-type ribon-helix-helix transcriptional regulator
MPPVEPQLQDSFSVDRAPLTAAVVLRLTNDTFDWIEDWRRSQPKIPSRSDAIRQLLELARGDEQRRSAAAGT